MSSNRKSDGMTRREMIGTASLAALGTTMLGATQARAAQQQVYQTGKDPGKHEPLEDFKFDLEAETGWVGEGGSAKEVTVEEFPVSKSIAGVSMRLKPGGIRELHWHAIAAEWALVLNGKVRTTVIAPNGEAATDDFGPGDIWYFPIGHGHSLQNMGDEECHFILGFDDGHFSEFGTFSITDWVARTSPNVVSRNLGLSPETVGNLPKKELYIIPGTKPPAIPEPYLSSNIETPQSPHKFRLENMAPATFPGGWERIVSSKEFPINTTLTSVLQYLEPGALREMHWHPNADEWQYYISGRSRVTIFGAHGRSKIEEFGPGQVCFIQKGFGHCVEQIGSEPTKIVALFNSPFFEEISISKWLAGNPPSLIADNFGLSKADVDRLPKKTLGIIA
ncbi:MAG TPA: cupin domain-containing protein [Candidatus Acidoferrales bacterium]|nr:cupin domain-containing protein [Candidatus Acidoferrales bacterium]